MIVRTVLPRKGFIQPGHGATVGAENDQDANLAKLDANVVFSSDLIEQAAAAAHTVLAGPVSGSAAVPSMRALDLADVPAGALLALALTAKVGLNGVISGFALSTSSSLTPGLTTGTLFAQGALYAPTGAPAPGAAPTNATNFLFFNAMTGFYYQSSAVGATAGDALIGQVVTGASAVTAVIQSTKLFGEVTVSASASGTFTVQHFLGRAPIGSIIRQTSSASIYWQSPTDVDATNLYLTASGAGTANILLF